jgi:hypothetical protein
VTLPGVAATRVGAGLPTVGWLHPGLAAARYAQPDPVHGAYAMLRSLVGFPGLGLSDSTAGLLGRLSPLEQGVFITLYVGVGLLLVAPFVVAWRGRRQGRARSDVAAMLLAFLGLFSLFAVVWEPSDPEFWLPVMAGWWLWVAWLLGTLEPSPRRAVVRALVLLVAVLGAYNAVALILPARHARHDLTWSQAEAIAKELRPQDLAVVIASSRLADFAWYRSGGRTTTERALVDAMGRRASGLAGLPVRQAREARGKVYLIWEPSALPVLGLTAAVLEDHSIASSWGVPGLEVRELRPVPQVPADEDAVRDHGP